MTLTVEVYTIDETDDIVFLPMEEGKMLFGFEHDRHSLWGNQVLKDLDMKSLTKLQFDNIDSYKIDIDALYGEFLIIKSNFEIIARHTYYDPEVFLFHIQNAIDAILRAKEHGYHVVIW